MFGGAYGDARMPNWPHWHKNVSCYIHGDGTFDLKIHAVVVVWGGGNLYNLDEMEREMIFYKTMKKKFTNLFGTWEKCESLNCGNFCGTTRIRFPMSPNENKNMNMIASTSTSENNECMWACVIIYFEILGKYKKSGQKFWGNTRNLDKNKENFFFNF